MEEMSGHPLLDPGSIPLDVSPASIALVGGYGLRIRWSDGHDTGIYTFQQLAPSAAAPAAPAPTLPSGLVECPVR